MRKLWLLVCVLLAGCARNSTLPGNETDPEAVFQRLAGDYIAGYLVWRPQTGTALGLHEYDGRLTDFRLASLSGELRRLKSFDQRLASINPHQLSSHAYYNYRILRGAVQRELFSFEQAKIYSRNPMTYAGALDVNIYIKRDFAPLEQRVQSIISILNQAPDLFVAAKANLDPVLPRPMVETAIEEADGSAEFLAKDLVEAVKGVKNESLLEAFDAADRRAVYAVRDFATYLKEKKLPVADDSYALGREKYMKLLEAGELVTLTPEEILTYGLRELKEKQRVFAEAAHEINPDKSPIDVFQDIQNDHPSEVNLLPDTARHLEMIRQFAATRNLLTIPSPVRAKVAETPRYLRATSFASMDTPGPFETRATEAYYYVTPPEANWTPKQKDEWLTSFNYYTTDVVSIHEAYPGHYVQYLCLNASPADTLEKIFVSYAFSEGWAHYAEQMMLDEGFGGAMPSGPDQHATAAKYRLAQTDEALLRVCRLCVSIKMHCQGMTVDEAARFMHENCYYAEQPARAEALRGAYDPEYLYYTLGKLEILKLREDYRKQQGADFSLQRFHDEMLRHGSPPLRLLREVMLHDPSLWDRIL